MQDVTLTYDRFDPASEGLREALTSTGNGYFCTRGTAEWEDAGTVHYPGTYAHGGFNRETTILGGRPVLNEDLVNLPNWLVLKLRIEGADAIRLDNVELLSYRHDYDIRRALVGRELRFRDLAGRETTLRSRRFVSMADSHQAGIEWILTPQNWSGRMEVVSALDGRVTNQMVARYRELEGRHLNPVSPRTFGPQTIALKVQTRQSNIYIAEAARTRVFRGDGPAVVERSLYQMEDYIQQVLAFDVTVGEPVRVEKLVALFTSHDNAITEPLAAAGRHVLRYPDFAAALAEHEGAWTELWDICDVQLPREPRVQLLLRFHTAHRAAGLLPPHRPARRGRPGPRAQRRGLPRPRVLGRALRLPVPQLPAPGDHPRAAALPLPPTVRGTGGGAGGRLPGRDVPVAKRQRRHRGDPGRPPQPAVRAVGTRPQPQPAARQRGDLLQRVAVLPGHRRPGVPPRLRRRADARDRPLLGVHRALQPRAGPLRDPRRDGTR